MDTADMKELKRLARKDAKARAQAEAQALTDKEEAERLERAKRWHDNAPRVGTGFLRLRDTKRNPEGKPVAWLLNGSLTLPGGQTVVLQCTMLEGATEREIRVLEYGTWTKLAEFKMPLFGDQPYVDTELPINGRTYKVRTIKQPDRPFMMLRLPQVLSNPSDAGAFA